MTTDQQELQAPLASLRHGQSVRFSPFFLRRNREQARAAIDPALPPPLRKIIERVLDRTRLWPRENEDVALELSAHFAEGLEAGRSVEKLAAEFGNADTAARLIRRAKIRNRPWAWHAAQRGWQGAAIFLVGWTILTAAYFGGSPKLSRDFIGEDDAQTRKIPADDRAWPLYREGLEKIDRKTWRAFRDQKDGDPVHKGPEHPNWPLVEKFLDANRPSLEIYLQGGKRKHLGYIYRDPTNDRWLHLAGITRTSMQIYAPGVRDILLPNIDQLRWNVDLVMSTAARDAIYRGHGKQAVEYWSARLGLAEQFWRDSKYGIFDANACVIVRTVSRQILKALAEHSDNLSDEDLTELARNLRSACDGRPRIRWNWLVREVDDFLQRSYSDDGDGKGHFLSQGMKFLEELRKNDTAYAEEMIGSEGLPADTDRVLSVVADRREMRTKMIELVEHVIAVKNRPFWEQDLSRCKKDLETLRDQPDLHRKYFPALVLLAIWGPIGDQYWRDGMVDVTTLLARDAALTMIAVTLQKRRTGEWPARLEELVPSLLSSVPKDPFDGKPLRYRVEGRIPHLYSIGRDRKDDHGAPPAKGDTGWKAETGDWQLFPPLHDEEE